MANGMFAREKRQRRQKLRWLLFRGAPNVAGFIYVDLGRRAFGREVA